MHRLRKHSATSNMFRVMLRSSATGQGLTGLDTSSTGLIISTIADVEAAATSYTVAGSTIETISTLGTFATPTSTKCRFKAVDGTNHPGLYELHFDDARFSVSSATVLRVGISGAASLLAKDITIQLTKLDVDDATRAGLTALPNAAAEAAGGLYTRGTGAGQINQPANGMADVNVVRNAGTAITAASGIQEVKVASLADGVIAAATFAANALDAAWSTATRVLTAATNLTTALATPTNITAGTITTVTNLTNAPTAGDLTATMKASVNAEVDTAITDAALATAANLALVPTAAQNADKLLGRNLAGGADGTRTVQDALRAARNKVVIDGTTITVYAEDDTTPAWTGTVTRVSRDALDTVDPA